MELTLHCCTLRAWRRTDREALCRHANNPAIAGNLRDAFPHPYTSEHAERWLSMCEKQQPQTFFAIAVGQEAVGGIGLTLHEDVERVAAELGYWLSEQHWGKGIVTAAVVALTDWAFATFPLTRIYAMPYARNTASARVLEKAGFALEGLLRRSIIKHGVVQDQFMYSRVREAPSAEASSNPRS